MTGMRERGKDARNFESWDKWVQLSLAESRIRKIRVC